MGHIPASPDPLNRTSQLKLWRKSLSSSWDVLGEHWLAQWLLNKQSGGWGRNNEGAPKRTPFLGITDTQKLGGRFTRAAPFRQPRILWRIKLRGCLCCAWIADEAFRFWPTCSSKAAGKGEGGQESGFLRQKTTSLCPSGKPGCGTMPWGAQH